MTFAPTPQEELLFHARRLPIRREPRRNEPPPGQQASDWLMMKYAVACLALFIGAEALAQRTGLERSVRFSTFQQGHHSRFERAGQRILQTEGDFQKYWSELTGRPPHEAPRGVDWNRNYLVAIHLGTRPTGGYGVSVRSIERTTPNDLVLTYVETRPRPDAMVTQALTSPWVIVAVERVPGNLRFRAEVTTVGSIGGGTGSGGDPIRLPGGVTIIPGQAPPPVVIIIQPIPYTFVTGYAPPGFGHFEVAYDQRRFEILLGQMGGFERIQEQWRIDWGREAVAFVASRSASSASIRISEVGLTATCETIIRYRESYGGAISPANRVPVALVRIPLGSGPIRAIGS